MLIDKFQFVKPRSQLNTDSTKPLLHGNIHNHAIAVFLFPFLPLADIAFEEFGLFKEYVQAAGIPHQTACYN